MSALDRIHESEGTNYQTSRLVLGDSIELVQDFADLYQHEVIE